jgi:hypothetical protein
MARKGCRWTDEEGEIISQMYIEDELKISDIAKKQERSEGAITCRLKQLGILKIEDNEMMQLKEEVKELKNSVQEMLEMMRSIWQYEKE